MKPYYPQQPFVTGFELNYRRCVCRLNDDLGHEVGALVQCLSSWLATGPMPTLRVLEVAELLRYQPRRAAMHSDLKTEAAQRYAELDSYSRDPV